MLYFLVGLFFVAHGLVHLLFLSPEPPASDKGSAWPFDRSDSWLLNRIGLREPAARRVGALFCAVPAAGFVLAGLGAWGLSGAWESLAAFAAASGLILLILYWHLWLTLGIAINLVILIAVL